MLSPATFFYIPDYNWKYKYDSHGNIKNITKQDTNTGLIQTIYFEYNAKNQPLTITNPRGNIISYTYDNITGNLLSETNALGHKTTYTYTPAAKIQTATLPNSQKLTYIYDYDLADNALSSQINTASPSTINSIQTLNYTTANR